MSRRAARSSEREPRYVTTSAPSPQDVEGAAAEDSMPDDPGASLPEPELKPEPEPEPEPAEGAPDFGAGLPDEVLRRLLLA